MLFKPKDELYKYHGDCSYEESGCVPAYEEISIPVEVMNLCVIHVGHSIFCLRHKRRTRNFRHSVQGEVFLFQSILKQQPLPTGMTMFKK